MSKGNGSDSVNIKDFDDRFFEMQGLKIERKPGIQVKCFITASGSNILSEYKEEEDGIYLVNAFVIRPIMLPNGETIIDFTPMRVIPPEDINEDVVDGPINPNTIMSSYPVGPRTVDKYLFILTKIRMLQEEKTNPSEILLPKDMGKIVTPN